MRLMIDNWRWAGVPFYLRTGKALAARKTEIAIKFRSAPLALFRDMPVDSLAQNLLVLRIQPDEGAALHFNAKIPGPEIRIENVRMNFKYEDYFDAAPSTGYETLIYDCMIGDPMLFQRAIDIEAGWRVVDPILESLARGRRARSAPLPGGQRRAASGGTICWRAAGSNGGRSHERRQRPAMPHLRHAGTAGASGVADWIVERARGAAQRFALCLSGGDDTEAALRTSRRRRRAATVSRGSGRIGSGATSAWFRMTIRAAIFTWPAEALLRHAPVPPENIHAIPTERISAAAGAAPNTRPCLSASMARTARCRPAAVRPDFARARRGRPYRFVVSGQSGAGGDGSAGSCRSSAPGELDRITLTYPALASSAAVAFLVVGARKREALAARARRRSGAAGGATAAGRRRSIGSPTAPRRAMAAVQRRVNRWICAPDLRTGCDRFGNGRAAARCVDRSAAALPSVIVVMGVSGKRKIHDRHAARAARCAGNSRTATGFIRPATSTRCMPASR